MIKSDIKLVSDLDTYFKVNWLGFQIGWEKEKQWVKKGYTTVILKILWQQEDLHRKAQIMFVNLHNGTEILGPDINKWQITFNNICCICTSIKVNIKIIRVKTIVKVVSMFELWIRNKEDFKFRELGSRLDFGLIKIDIKE